MSDKDDLIADYQAELTMRIQRIEKLEKALSTIKRIRAPYPDLSISKYVDTIDMMRIIAQKALEE